MFRNDYTEDKFVEAFVRIADNLEKLVNRPTPEPETRTFDDIRRLVVAGETIQAIRLFRALTSASLKDAKEQVDAIRNPV